MSSQHADLEPAHEQLEEDGADRPQVSLCGIYLFLYYILYTIYYKLHTIYYLIYEIYHFSYII